MEKMTRRDFLKAAGTAAVGVAAYNLEGVRNVFAAGEGSVKVSANGGAGSRAKVYFSRNINADTLIKLYDMINEGIYGKVAIKLHTGEPHGPNILPREMVKAFQAHVPNSNIVETNDLYEGGRDTTEKHRASITLIGWDFCPVDIMDENGTAVLPVKNGKWFTEMHVGKNLLNYDSLFVLTHFKGHVQGGFGGSDKNIGIGCADGRIGKAMIHTTPGSTNQWDIAKEEFMERMTESSKAVVDHFGKNIAFVNVMRNMSVSCDCEGTAAEPVVTPNVGILASLDILAIDQASVDLIYAMKETDRKALVTRMETRHGLRQLTYMKELGMGNDKYKLIDIDNGDKEITLEEAVKDVVPFKAE